MLYKPLSLGASVLGGVLAGAIAKQAWKLAAGDDEVPSATDAQRGWAEVLLAAGLQGAVFGLVKAAVDRGAAAGARRLTGSWPGDDGMGVGRGGRAGWGAAVCGSGGRLPPGVRWAASWPGPAFPELTSALLHLAHQAAQCRWRPGRPAGT